MGIKAFMTPKTLFARLMATFLAILLLLSLLSVGVHQWGMVIIRKQLEQSMLSHNAYYQQVFESEISRSQRLAESLMTDGDLQKLSSIALSLNDYERSASLNRLHDKLYSVQNSSLYIEDVMAIIPELNRMVSARRGVNPVTDAEDRILGTFRHGGISKMETDSGRLYYRLRNIATDTADARPSYLIQIAYSNESLMETLKALVLYPGGGSILYHAGLGFSLATDASLMEDLSLVEPLLLQESSSSPMQRQVLHETDLLVFSQKLVDNDLWLISFVPEKAVYAPLGIYLYVMWAVFLLSFLILSVFSISTRRFLQKPMKDLVKAFHQVEDGSLEVALPQDTHDEFKYLYARFNAMLEYLRNLIDQVYKQQLLSQKAELKQLQSQINPHFLYNSFFMLQRLIQSEDRESAASLCSYLGNYFQYVTRNAQEELPLSQEVDHARNYLEIQQMRFSRMLVTFGTLPEAYASMLVPRLILQPVIENVFEHGLAHRAEQQAIRVGFEETEGVFRILIEDNGKGATPEHLDEMNRRLQSKDTQETEVTGIINVNRRIRLRFSGNSGVWVARSDMGGWKVCLCFDRKGEACEPTVDRG